MKKLIVLIVLICLYLGLTDIYVRTHNENVNRLRNEGANRGIKAGDCVRMLEDTKVIKVECK